MNQTEKNESINDSAESSGIVKEPEPQAVGIAGDTTNHDLIMTRIWIRDNVCENISIDVLGAEFTKARARKIEKHLKGKKIDDIQLIIGLNMSFTRGESNFPLDALFESICRAVNDYRKRAKEMTSDIHQDESSREDEMDFAKGDK
jgi:hypothetical protein